MSDIPGWLTVGEFSTRLRSFGVHIGAPAVRYHCRTGHLKDEARDGGHAYLIPEASVATFAADYLARATRKGRLS
jgi:hypothetical protein